jgi:hypothetical protein
MGVDVEVLFYKPQQEIASRLRDYVKRSVSVSMVSGFATPSGIAQISEPLSASPSKLEALVVGAGTFKAFEAMDGLLDAGIGSDKLFVHLGMSRATGGRKNPFARYRPMLHSKIYLLDMGAAKAAAFVGSHNLTGFAMQGLNGEAGILLEGDAVDPAFDALRRHVTISIAQATQYNRALKAAYAWWTAEFLDGLRVEVNDSPKDSETRNTLIVMASAESGQSPSPKEVIYFELPQELGLESLRAEVHVFIFDTLPSTPYEALQNLQSARASLRCSTLGIDKDRGNLEVRADWYIDDRKRAMLKRTQRPFRPNPQGGMQQVRVQVEAAFRPDFEYLFATEHLSWAPILDATNHLDGTTESDQQLQKREAKRPEDGRWFPVRALEQRAPEEATSKELALLEASPSSGSFIVVSPRRRRAKV